MLSCHAKCSIFDPIFQQERTVQGIYERFCEIASSKKTKSSSPDDVEISTVAQEIVDRMQAASPLALNVIYQLLQKGRNEIETYESCIERERKIQAKLFTSPDYATWAASAQQQKTSSSTKEPVVRMNWKHKSIRDVPSDEVLEIIGA